MMNSIQEFQKLSSKYSKDIEYSIAHSVVYDGDRLPEGDYPDGFDTKVCVVDATVQEILAQLCGYPLAVLNFSCKRNPAGQTRMSSKGQEADLSRISFLPTILSSGKLTLEYYVRNRESDRYGNDVIAYTPRVPFIFDSSSNTHYIDVISCAAPTTRFSQSYSADRIRSALERRIDIIFSSALCNGIRNILLGAWGCGGCELNASLVAHAFKAVLDTGYFSVFENVIFAVPKTFEDDHFDIFKSVFGGDFSAK